MFLDEVDLRIVNAVQFSPRASWSRLGAAVGVAPATVARRWGRLTSDGRAWATMSPGPRLLASICIAYLEIDCVAGTAGRVGAALAEDANAVTVELTSGTHDLIVTAAATDLAALSRYVEEHVAVLTGVTSVRTRIVTRMLTEGGRYRLDTLAPGERAALHDNSPDVHSRDTGTTIDEQTRAMFGLLTVDGRLSYEDLGAALSISPATARRRIDRLVSAGLLTIRCDFARPLAGWPVSANLWAKVSATNLTEVGQTLIHLPEVRNCAVVSGPNNLLTQVWLHSIADAQRLETDITAKCPDIELADRAFTMRHVKLFGRLLDNQGRSVRTIPPDIWAAPGPFATPG